MNIILNGRTAETADNTALPRLLKSHGLDRIEPRVVLVNGTIVPPEKQAALKLKTNDKVEVITLAAGG